MMPLHPMLLAILLLAAALSPCLSHVLNQATRREVVERLTNAALRAPQPRRSGGPCTLPTGTAPSTTAPDGWVYHGYYGGWGFTEDPKNPGNPPGYPSYTNDLGFLDIPDAVQQCAQHAYDDTDVYYSFDLHFLTSTCTWICVQYINPNEDPSFFDQPNTDVAIGYGYYATEYGD